MRRRRNILFVIELFVFILGGFLMYTLQSHLFYRNANREIGLTFQDVDRIVSQVEKESDNSYNSYELILKAKAQMAEFYIRNDEDTVYSVTSINKLKSRLNVHNVYLTDPDGRIAYFAEPADIKSFSEGDLLFFPEMEKIAGTNEASSVYYYYTETDKGDETGKGDASAEDSASDTAYESEEDVSDEDDDSIKDDTEASSDGIDLHCFCAASLANGYYVVIEDNAAGLFEHQDVVASWQSLLPRITLGRNGFVFAVDSTGWVAGFPDQGKEEITDISELGISTSVLRDGAMDTLVLCGESLYCGIKYYEGQDVYIICAIPTQEITGNVLAVTAVPLFVAFIFLSLQLLYALMLMGEHNPDPHGADQLSFRFLLFKRMAVLLVLSILFTIGSSLYTQALYATYLQAHSNMQESSALRSSLSRNEEDQKKTSEEYYSYLENLTSLAAAFVSNNKKQITKKDLSEMAFKLGAEHILLYNNKGEVILSDAYYKGLELSSSPRELSNEFRKLLTGTPVLSQQTVDEDYLDKPYRYVGAIVTNSEDEPNGFIQLAFSPDYLKSSLSETTVGSLPSTFSGRNNAFAFIVDAKDHTVIYYPDESVIDQDVEDYGLKEDMLQDDYFVCTWFDDQERLLYSSFWNDDIIYTAASVNVITMESMSRGIYISVAGIIIQLLFFLILFIIAGDNRSYAMEISGDEWAIEAQNKLVERLAAGRILRLLNISFFIFSGAVCFILLLRDLIFRNNYVILDLLNGHWNRGLHLFAFTACWITVCIVFFVMSLLLFVLKLTGKLMNSRGETIISMLISFARYIAVIGTVFYCAKLLGAPTDTLLASAGILTVVVGLGAQSLVTDVLAGLFIIFEKAFKVGDIIKVEPEEWRGRVLEIGIRNTRVMDIDANNVKIIHNSSLNQIVNLSDLPTYCYTTIGIEYSEGLSRVEEIIKAELPDIRKRIPEATEGPLYCGVSELGDSAVILKFRTSCRNEDYLRVRYAVNRELKLLFDRHSINIPFPQVVINPREEKEHIYREL